MKVLDLVTIAVEVPLTNSILCEGTFAKALYGADIAWTLGLFIPAVVHDQRVRAGRLTRPAATASG